MWHGAPRQGRGGSGVSRDPARARRSWEGAADSRCCGGLEVLRGRGARGRAENEAVVRESSAECGCRLPQEPEQRGPRAEPGVRQGAGRAAAAGTGARGLSGPVSPRSTGPLGSGRQKARGQCGLRPGRCGGQVGADGARPPGSPAHVLTLSQATSQGDTQPQPEADPQAGAHMGPHGAGPAGRGHSATAASALPDRQAGTSACTLAPRGQAWAPQGLSTWAPSKGPGRSSWEREVAVLHPSTLQPLALSQLRSRTPPSGRIFSTGQHGR